MKFIWGWKVFVNEFFKNLSAFTKHLFEKGITKQGFPKKSGTL